ncbi:MAG: hypothetical protein ACFCVH_14380, partial [Alphaproteobacteria bacterium]
RRRDDGPEDSQPLATDGAAAPIDQDAQLARSSNDRDAEAVHEDRDIVPEAQDELGREASPESAPPESAPEASGEVVAELISARAVDEPDPVGEPAPGQETPRAKAEPAAESGNGRAPAEEESTAARDVDSVDEDIPEEPVEDREPVHAESGPATRGDRDDRLADSRPEQQPRRGWWQRLIEG